MPSATHQNFVLLFERHPELAFELARRAGAPVADDYERFEMVSAEFEDPLDPENPIRGDLALAGHRNGKPRRALVIEVQLGIDLNKEWTVVLYQAALRRRLHCPTWVVWFSPDPEVRASVDDRMFQEEPHLRPVVATPEMIPVVRDLETAMANYAWAVLAATVHATGPDAVVTARVAIQAVLRVAPDDFHRYIQLISDSIGEEAMQQVRDQLPPEDEEPLSAWERRGSSFVRGRKEGLAEGLEQGREQGLEGLRAALRTILEVRGLPIDDRVQAQITACTAFEQLRSLIERAATVPTAAELFGADHE